MSEEINIPKKVLTTPYKDYEHPSIRFNIKETKDVTKHLLFYKTDKENTFLERRNPTDILMDMFMEIQTLPKINSKDDKDDSKKEMTIEQLHEMFKVTSKSKRKAMMDRS